MFKTKSISKPVFIANHAPFLCVKAGTLKSLNTIEHSIEIAKIHYQNGKNFAEVKMPHILRSSLRTRKILKVMAVRENIVVVCESATQHPSIHPS